MQAIMDANGVKGKEVKLINQDGLLDLIQSIIFKTQETKDPFYLLDLGVVTSLMDTWTRTLPAIRPFYAVKCNPHSALLGTLVALGSNFDCATKSEIESVLSLGVSPDRIVFANPCKPESHIKYAASVGVNLTTFDSIHELQKLQKFHPQCDLLIRIKPPDNDGARFPLGTKYGALPEEIVPLLQAAESERLKVIGVSFHVGSGATHSGVYTRAIAAAKTVFETAARLGMPGLKILNIGGGFTAGKQFEEAALAIKDATQAHFANEPGLTIISEPGRFFSESAFTLVTNIIGKRVRDELREYWINDGVYGSMNCIIYEHGNVACAPLACNSIGLNPMCKGLRTYSSTVFGPTCDAIDTILEGCQLPELQVNDWLVFPNMGAYTIALASNFNGFNTKEMHTYLTYSDPSLG